MLIPGERAILLVEDETLLREEYARWLESEGFSVVGAESAEEALALPEGSRFDAVLSDNVLPGMTGLRALPELTRRFGAPVLMMSSRYDEDFVHDALALGARACLRKPLERVAALRELERALEREGAGAP